MTDDILFGLTFISALGCGLIAGVFFAFSTFVMKALARLPTTQGIAAMQSINVTVINPWFMGAFLGTAVICVLLAGTALFHWQRPASPYLLAGSMLYVLGSVLVTMWFNVPRNNALAIVDAAANGPAVWTRFVAEWSAWNHARTIASFLAAGSFTIGITKIVS
jgi:uncharacterized membrane protein